MPVQKYSSSPQGKTDNFWYSTKDYQVYKETKKIGYNEENTLESDPGLTQLLELEGKEIKMVIIIVPYIFKSYIEIWKI